MYYVSVRIRYQEVHVVELQSRSEQLEAGEGHPAPEPLPSFVIVRDRVTTATRLLTIDHKAKLVVRNGYRHDLVIQAISLIETSPGALTIHLHTEPSDVPTSTVSDTFELLTVQEASNVERELWAKAGAPETVVITLRIAVGGQAYQGQFTCYSPAVEQTYEIVMDFGSEASQIVVTGRENGVPQIRRFDIVDSLLKNFYKNFNRDDLHQNDADTELIRSLVFLRRKGSVFLPDAPPNQYGDEEYVKLLTERTANDQLAETHALIANLKLAHLGAYTFPISFKDRLSNPFEALQLRFDDTIGQLQQGVISSFLHGVLATIQNGRTEKIPFYAIVKLLVPNVFEQERVSRLVRGTYLNLSQMAAEYNLRGVEVNTLSESDAAFLGYTERLAQQRKAGAPDRRSVIIDAGKGTTDFSIIEQADEIRSIYRSGFIGAGNVLSYAFIETVFAGIFGKNPPARRQAIFNIALGPTTDLRNKIAFLEVIEALKRAYNKVEDQTHYKRLSELIEPELADIRREYVVNPSDARLLGKITAALQFILAQRISIKDEFGFIDNAVGRLTSRIHREIAYSGCFQEEEIQPGNQLNVILTGRAFLFQPFTDAIQERFPQATLALTGDDPTELKKISLEGAFSTKIVNAGSHMVGRPLIYEPSQVAGIEIREIDRGKGTPKMVTHSAPETSELPQEAKDKVESLWQRAYRELKKLENNAPIDDEPEAIPVPVVARPAEPETESLGLSQLDVLHSGLPFTTYNPRKEIIAVNGVAYQHTDIRSNPDAINIFFDGEGFLLRTATEAVPLSLKRGFFKKNQFVFETLFPYQSVADPNDVVVDETVTDDYI